MQSVYLKTLCLIVGLAGMSACGTSQPTRYYLLSSAAPDTTSEPVQGELTIGVKRKLQLSLAEFIGGSRDGPFQPPSQVNTERVHPHRIWNGKYDGYLVSHRNGKHVTGFKQTSHPGCLDRDQGTPLRTPVPGTAGHEGTYK